MATQSYDEKLKLIKANILAYPDFPKAGILFQDIFSALAKGNICKVLKEVVLEYVKINFPDIEAVIGLESRGFLLCFMVAAELELACIPIRKKGKLPGDVKSYNYSLEYGEDVFEVQTAFLRPGLKCLIVDDLIATGGSMLAGINLLKNAGCDVLGCLAVIELGYLNGKDKIREETGVKVHALLNYK